MNRATYSQSCRADVRCEILLEGAACSELVAWCDLPKPDRRIGAHPSVNLVVLVVARVLVLVINLHRARVKPTHP